jgi:hypothetical protein
MPFDISDFAICGSCVHGKCVSYIREQSKRMKDRDTQYRIAQRVIMACSFDEWIPGFTMECEPPTTFDFFLDRCIRNATSAGEYIQEFSPNHFGPVEREFFLTSAQIGKVRGDIFEMLSRAILWNISVALSGGRVDKLPECVSKKIVGRVSKCTLAAITLGDDYDLKRLFKPEAVEKFEQYEYKLAAAGTSMCYSTPDIVILRIRDESLQSDFLTPINSLSIINQDILSSAKKKLEGRLEPEDVLLAAGLKTSIRSDRMYQLLFEANSWKAIWRLVYKKTPPKYFGVVTRSYGADPEKLQSLEFLGAVAESSPVKAIDGLAHISRPLDLMHWYVDSIK